MKQTFLLFCFLFASIQSMAQKEDYLVLEGTIGKYPVSMELTLNSLYEFDENSGPIYSGYYHYLSKEIPITIYQKDTVSNSKEMLYLISWDDDEHQEIFNGKYTNGVYKGIWTKNNKSLNFELKKTSKKNYTPLIHLHEKKKINIKTNKTTEAVGAIFQYDWYVPEDLNLQKELVKIIDETYTNFQDYSQKNLRTFEKDYKSETEDLLKEMDEVYPSMLNHEYYNGFSPVLNSKNYLVMKHIIYEYTGGAHGMSYQKYLTYDKRTKKWLSIDDILDVKHEKNINKVLDKELRKQYNVPSGVKLNEADDSFFLVESVYYSKNFTLSKEGITFHYGLYEMTPYAYGFFSLYVPYKDLKPYMKKDFKY